MPKINELVKKKDKIIIYFTTAKKIIRGLLKSPFFGVLSSHFL